MRRGLIGAAIAIAVAVAGMPVAANAAQPTATRLPAHTRQLCPQPSDRHQTTCSALVRTDVPAHLGVTPADTPEGYGPNDLQVAYQLPPASTDTAVGLVVAFDDPTAEADLAVYRQQFGLPPCTTDNGCFAKVNQSGGTTYPQANTYWAGETAMDLDVLSAVCPTCHLTLVEADDTLVTHIGAAVNTAVSLGATSVVDAAAGFEEPDEAQLDQAYFSHPGVTITAPAGDYGYSNGTATPYPGVSPNVLAVGGTSLTRDPNSPRGWNETAWSNSGSGCSAYEPKPAFQHDTGCARTTAADIAAVADPDTGVAAYNSYQAGGWTVMGGTGGAAAIVAGIAALAGTNGPAKAYPYAAPAALFDITSGSAGFCDGSYLCTAGPGYDAPTGMGSPRGLLALQPPDHHGEVIGTVTDAATGAPLSDASVSAGATTVTTGASGHYDLPLAVGSHDVTATAFGHDPLTAKAVSVSAQATAAQDFALTAQPSVTLSGTVADGSGHGWPVYAKITAQGMPGGTVYTDPTTGHYALAVPRGQAEALQISPVYPGYQPVTATVQVGDQDTVANYQVNVDSTTCTAPGYAYRYQGLYEPFDATSAPAGWTVRDDNGSDLDWTFDDQGHRGNHTGGSGAFAIIDGEFDGEPNVKDTELISPTVDLSQVDAPTIGFGTDLQNLGANASAAVDLSVDGGTTWQNVWHQTANLPGPRVVIIPAPQAAGHTAVQVRFHYTGQWDQWWQVDNTFVGVRTCSPSPGGLVVGQVADRNTGNGLVDATVSGPATATTVATPADGNLGDGEYWLFAPAGPQQLTAASGRFFQKQATTVTVAADLATRADFHLAAGRIALSTTTPSSTQVLGTSATRKLTITNTGSAAATVTLAEQAAGDPPVGAAAGGAAAAGAAAVRIAGNYSPLRTGAAAASGTLDAAPDVVPWQPITHYPIAIMDNSASYGDGEIYSVGGLSSTGQVVPDGYAYQPGSQQWTPIAPMPHARQKPAVAFIGGELIVAGGWDQTGATVAQTDVYDPVSNTWTAGRSVPAAYAGAGAAELDGRMYVVGGCTDQCGTTAAYVYDPSTDQWTTAAPYPKPVAWEACAGLAGKVYCTGGLNQLSAYTSTYAYDPATNRWSPVADLPIDLWGAGYAAVGGKLIVSGGITQYGHTLTNQSFGYDPTTDTWATLADSTYPVYRGGSACGFYKIGGSPGYFTPVANAEQLPGLDQCGGAANLPWVGSAPAHATMAPGASLTVTMSFDAATVGITQPGTLSGTVAVEEDTPYDVSDLALTMTVTPPRTWGQVTGAVTGVNCDGSVAPLAGAVVQINSSARQVSVVTDAAGHYGYWLDKRDNPLSVIVADDTWQPQTRTIRIDAGKTTEADFALSPVRTCH